MSYPIAKKRRSLGFTLIELLVVISIIGMLSSVVLASLKSARDKAQDAKIKAQLRNLRNSAQAYYINNNTYGLQILGTEPRVNTIGAGCNNHMFTDPSLIPYLAASNYPPYAIDVGSRCVVLGDASGNPLIPTDRYMVVVKLSTGLYYCIDSKGKTREAAYQGDAIPPPTWNTGTTAGVNECIDLMSW